MNKQTKTATVLTGLLLLVVAPGANAGAPTCTTHTTGPYCEYTGKVDQVYVNDGGRILMYFDTPLDLTLPSAVGISGVTNSAATSYSVPTDPTFAQFFYSSILAAQARDVTVTIQMRGADAGYLVVDRIWITE